MPWIRKTTLILIVIFIIASIYILSFPYPWGKGAENPHIPGGSSHYAPWQRKIWSGGTIPDENAYFQWAWIYYTTGRNYIPLEDIGPDKIQHFSFFIGNSSQDSYFMRVTISQIGGKWESRFRDVTVSVYNGLNKGVPQVAVDLMDKRTGEVWHGITNGNGEMTLRLPPGFYRATAHIGNVDLVFDFATNFANLDYPIMAYATLQSLSILATIKIHVDHYINGNLSGVEIHFGKDPSPLGYTNKDGNFYLEVQPGRMYGITAIKRTYHIAPPIGSVVVYVNGEYALANRWAPGYSYLMIPFWLAGLINFIPIFTFFIGSVATYLLARRLYGDLVAFYSSLLFMLTGLGLMMLFSRGMADYATMAFSTLGIMLAVESIQKRRWEKIENPLLALTGGLSLGFAVIIRYSTVTVALAPIIYLAARMITKRETLKKEILSFSTFILGLAIMGIILASYNSALFGGPLNSGYQMSHRIEFINGNATIETPTTNMFEKYFHPSWEALNNIFKRILPQLFLLLPTLFIAPLGFFLDYRRSRTWLMLLWGIPTLLIYMQLPWVGHVPYEDMRYFLPLLPPTAILSGVSLKFVKDRDYEKLIFFALFAALGFVASFFAINWQLHRRESSGLLWKNPPIYAFIIALAVYFIIYWLVISTWMRKKESLLS